MGFVGNEDEIRIFNVLIEVHDLDMTCFTESLEKV